MAANPATVKKKMVNVMTCNLILIRVTSALGKIME